MSLTSLEKQTVEQFTREFESLFNPPATVAERVSESF